MESINTLESGITIEGPSIISLITAFVGSMTMAVCGGILWGLLSVLTKHEIRFMILFVGMLGSLSVIILSNKNKLFILQIIAISSIIPGFLASKYIVFFYHIKNLIIKEYGADIASYLPMIPGLSKVTIQFFLKSLIFSINSYDMAWIIITSIMVWEIPRIAFLYVKKHEFK
ncbi:MAG: hypothetical protein DKM50_03315 [Candidatus Margulisiibacteriota bacterium]|nr:MAG: hypothetical protein A2X43_09455 [Candidatus Margulisbacteria bacterium GWD2_39_127]OGI02884.1 MAG: hypothetical protein A2X42_02310 [Candidatus Margulisbacteria bacterium GWF2_38_17]OGI06820.1 MAG: hypothetical protein A2X41_03670 [Candidatus Margulisbacteria bacterium GWE2_39_32]PZM83008.1 MAG: hypothetical protein DKM50_03315 [Candidatus Margulisiibacteriota bacterium]HAR62168.1 hypothetical protein [Candidatus Margulisiibacteriota bacterium]